MAVLAAASPVIAQQTLFEESYLLPNQTIQSILNRDANYDVLNAMSPNGDHFVIPVSSDFSSFELMAQKTYRLGMLEICPDVNREWRLSTYGNRGLRIYSLRGRDFRSVKLPEGAFVSHTTWSPRGDKLAFLVHLRQGTQVWTADAATGEARSIADAYVMATLSGASPGRGSNARMLQWTSNDTVLTFLVPSDRGREPEAKAVPASPIIRRTLDKPSPTPTYPFLLRTQHDKDLFRYYTTAQLAELSAGRPPRRIGKPAMYMNLSLSPDGKHILAERLVEPFSYIVSYSSFGRDLEIMDLEGKIVSTVRKVPLQEGGSDFGPGGAGGGILASRPRDVAWRPDGKGLTLLWREPGKEGEGAESEAEDAPRKDRLMLLAPPFDMNGIQTLVTSEKSFSQVSYSRDGRYAFATLSERGSGAPSGRGTEGTSRRSIVAYDLSGGQPREHVLVKDYDPTDSIKLPGEILTQMNGNGIVHAVVSTDQAGAYLMGEGLKENFKHQPFVDRVTIASAAKERVFEGSATMFEQPLVPLNADLTQMIIGSESKTTFPDSYLWNRDGSRVKLTKNRNPFPEIASVQRIDFEFQRRDGLTVQANLSLPPDYRPGTRVPAVFWTYPREYQSFYDYKKSAIQARNHHSYQHLNTRNASDIWLLNGYAVVVPDIPIVGKGQAYNDNYIAHLVDSMYGAIRKIDAMGQIDVDRLGHGGHSYGAFATANILAHSPFFKAGIAGDGAFNRTLTPMRFQGERRFLWQAPSTYMEMSPFFAADHIDTPLLMYHGAEDNNTGTYLIQSERMIQALTGLGKNAVLYIYPFESHGPRCKETYMDMWARWLEWFDKYVKGDGDKKMTTGQ